MPGDPVETFIGWTGLGLGTILVFGAWKKVPVFGPHGLVTQALTTGKIPSAAPPNGAHLGPPGTAGTTGGYSGHPLNPGGSPFAPTPGAPPVVGPGSLLTDPRGFYGNAGRGWWSGITRGFGNTFGQVPGGVTGGAGSVWNGIVNGWRGTFGRLLP